MLLKQLTILLLLTPLVGVCQYRGGGNDGFVITNLPKTNITDNNAYRGGADDGFHVAFVSKTNIADVNAYRGGNDDGFAQTNLPKTIITDGNAYRGGNDDGFVQINLPKTIITDGNAYRGGNDDGFVQINLPKTIITDGNAYRGGNDDGFVLTNLPKTNITDAIAYKGGIGRGETQAMLNPLTCDGNTFTWNGSVSTAWENPDNWNCGIMPHIGSSVIIPNGVPYYPKVNANFEIKTLFVNTNASIMIMTGVIFKLNGQ
jgi:hypothetical protein